MIVLFNAFLEPNYFISFNRNTFVSLCTLSFRLISHIETELLARCLVTIKTNIDLHFTSNLFVECHLHTFRKINGPFNTFQMHYRIILATICYFSIITIHFFRIRLRKILLKIINYVIVLC